MTGKMIPWRRDVIGRSEPAVLTIVANGQRVPGVVGQTIGGILMAAGLNAWRQTSRKSQPRGLFCGIGVCYDCVCEVNGQSDVRACQRRANDGDVVVFQRGAALDQRDVGESS